MLACFAGCGTEAGTRPDHGTAMDVSAASGTAAPRDAASTGPAGSDDARPAVAAPDDPRDTDATDTAGPGDPETIVFLGNSLTAGYGLTLDEAYPALIQQKLDSAGYRYRVVNAGVSGETSAGGLRRIDWLLRQPITVLVLALGANDALRGHDLDNTRANLQAILDRTRAAYPDVSIVIAGMQAPPNLGSDYTDRFRTMFIDLARENDAALIPFLLEGVAAVPELNQPDGIHPTAEGQKILAENVWRTLEPVLRERTAAID